MKREIKKRLDSLRDEVAEKIVSIVNSVGGELYIMDIDEGNSPVLQFDSFDENNTYTLDKISVYSGGIDFDGSSSYANYTWKKDTLDIITLIDILDFLEEHEEEINELKED